MKDKIVIDEIWKDIKGYENYYQVSNLGNVKSLRRTIIRKNGNYIYYGNIFGTIESSKK